MSAFDPVLLIDRVKSACAVFGGRVAGINELMLAQRQDMADIFAAPHAFVASVSEEAEENQTVGAVSQRMDETFSVFVCVDATADRDGFAADATLRTARDQLVAAIKGWEPDAARAPFEYRGFTTMEITAARAWRRFDFSTFTME